MARSKPTKPKGPIEPTLDAGAKPAKKKRLWREGARGGRPRSPKTILHVPTPEMRKTIANMAGYGLDVLTICKLTGMSSATLYRYYKFEMQCSAAQKDLMVLQSAFLKAIGGPDQNWEKADAAQQRWWIGARQGWRPPADRQINANFNMDLNRLSDAQLAELERIMEAAAMDPGGRQALTLLPDQSED
jgi:hypothetical protein